MAVEGRRELGTGAATRSERQGEESKEFVQCLGRSPQVAGADGHTKRASTCTSPQRLRMQEGSSHPRHRHRHSKGAKLFR
eukprot:23836-Eustigmatos_ZCMA.PRE.1